MSSLHLIDVPPKQGYIWFRQGIWLFRRSPVGFLMLMFVYLLALQMGMLIPVLGVVAVLVLSPGLFVGLMVACREAVRGERLRPRMFVSAFSDYGAVARRRLLVLGVIHTVLMGVVSLIASMLIDVEALVPLIFQQQEPTADGIRALYFALGIGAALYAPVAMLMWFAPLLVAWEDVSPVKSMFFSWVACWRNRGAFLVYLLIWAIGLVAIPMLLGSTLGALGAGDAGQLLLTPYSVLMLAILYCSIYASWRGCFQPPENAGLDPAGESGDGHPADADRPPAD